MAEQYPFQLNVWLARYSAYNRKCYTTPYILYGVCIFAVGRHRCLPFCCIAPYCFQALDVLWECIEYIIWPRMSEFIPIQCKNYQSNSLRLCVNIYKIRLKNETQNTQRKPNTKTEMFKGTCSMCVVRSREPFGSRQKNNFVQKNQQNKWKWIFASTNRCFGFINIHGLFVVCFSFIYFTHQQQSIYSFISIVHHIFDAYPLRA